MRYRLRALAAKSVALAEREGRYVSAEEGKLATPWPHAPCLVDHEPPITNGDAVMRDIRDVLVREGPL